MTLRLGLAQINPSVGDITGNTNLIRRFYKQAVDLKLDVLVFPEMTVCGYPPEDLLLKKHFLEDNQNTVAAIAADCPAVTMLVGFAEQADGKCYNALAVLKNGKIEKIYRKNILPNYGVFDENRYFLPGTQPVQITVNCLSLALTICEDIWQLDTLKKLFEPLSDIDILINSSASPFHLGKIGQRQNILAKCAKQFDCAVAYCNLVGGQDELVFDGRSMFVDQTGNVTAQAHDFEQDLLAVQINRDDNNKITIETIKASSQPPNIQTEDSLSQIYKALVLGTHDYVRKNGFEKIVIGLSGGIDSSLVAAISVDALGPENVVGVTMPSKFNSPETQSDAKKLADNLNIKFHTIPIGPALQQLNETLSTIDGWQDTGIAYENLQARIRGTILMSLSNQFSYMVLTTGNKSETAVGYSTLYGDTAGGFAVIKDVPKTLVYKLSEYVNQKHNKEIIPPSVITRTPSAELSEGQADTDSLPEYDILDKILTGYIEQDKSAPQIVEQNINEEIIKRIIRMVDRNEYKRRQSPPGIKITPKAFGRDRRMPITNRYT